MKIQMDTVAKTIKVEQAVQFSELIETLERLLPNGEWKAFRLDTNTVINWTSPPIYVRPHINPWYEQPWWSGTGPGVTLCDGTYNIDTAGTENRVAYLSANNQHA